MHQLCVIANNYLIPVSQCLLAPSRGRSLSYHLSRRMCVARWDSRHCPPRKSRPAATPAIERVAGRCRCALELGCSRDPRVHRRYIRAERKERPQYFKVKLLELNGVGGTGRSIIVFHGDREVAPRPRIVGLMSSSFGRDDAIFRMSMNTLYIYIYTYTRSLIDII